MASPEIRPLNPSTRIILGEHGSLFIRDHLLARIPMDICSEFQRPSSSIATRCRNSFGRSQRYEAFTLSQHVQDGSLERDGCPQMRN